MARMRRTHALTAALAATAAAALAPAASAIPFGADLNRPANNTFGCETSGFIPAPGNPSQLILLPSGQTSCTWTSNGRLGDFAGTLAVPRTGTVTQVQIKTGPVVGPMQVVSFSTLNTFPINPNRPPACCQIKGRSRVFTPRPNGITTINVNLPVVTERTPPVGNIIRADGIGLSVLAPNVPVPAHNTGNFDALRGAPVGGVWYPAVQPGQELLSPAGLIGFQVLMRAELTPPGGRRPGGTGDAGNSGSSGSTGSERCAGVPATIVGTNRSETLRGTPRRDVFVAKGGRDRILGLGGNDIACGGPGNDILVGGGGNDVLIGEAGRDVARGGPGNDVLRGGSQNDRLFGNGGNDQLFGNAGRDVLVGAAGNDRLDGGSGRDRNLGGPGRDRCVRGSAASC